MAPPAQTMKPTALQLALALTVAKSKPQWLPIQGESLELTQGSTKRDIWSDFSNSKDHIAILRQAVRDELAAPVTAAPTHAREGPFKTAMYWHQMYIAAEKDWKVVRNKAGLENKRANKRSTQQTQMTDQEYLNDFEIADQNRKLPVPTSIASPDGFQPHAHFTAAMTSWDCQPMSGTLPRIICCSSVMTPSRSVKCSKRL